MLSGSTTDRILRQTTVPVLVAPLPDQTPPTMDPSRVEVGRVLAPVEFKDDSVTEVRAAVVLLNRWAFLCRSFKWSPRSKGSSAFDRSSTRTTAYRLSEQNDRFSSSLQRCACQRAPKPRRRRIACRRDCSERGHARRWAYSHEPSKSGAHVRTAASGPSRIAF